MDASSLRNFVVQEIEYLATVKEAGQLSPEEFQATQAVLQAYCFPFECVCVTINKTKQLKCRSHVFLFQFSNMYICEYIHTSLFLSLSLSLYMYI